MAHEKQRGIPSLKIYHRSTI